MLSLIGELCAGGLLCGGGMRMDVLGGEMDRVPVVVPAPGVEAGVGVGDAWGILDKKEDTGISQTTLNRRQKAVVIRCSDWTKRNERTGGLNSLLWAGNCSSDCILRRHAGLGHCVVPRVKVFPVLWT